MGNSNKSRPSVNSKPNSAALVTTVDSELDFFTNSNYLAFESLKFAAAQREGKLASDAIDDPVADPFEDDPEAPEEPQEPGDPNKRPALSDIEVVSNEAIRGVADIPTAKIVFKVKNSSGVELKAINVRVEKK